MISSQVNGMFEVDKLPGHHIHQTLNE